MKTFDVLGIMFGVYLGFCLGNILYLIGINQLSQEHILKSFIPTLVNREILIEDLQKENNMLIIEIRNFKK